MSKGQEYIDDILAMVDAANELGMAIGCGLACEYDADFIGMQECGEPGGPLCQMHADEHINNIRRAVKEARDAGVTPQPYCRHCGENVDMNHLYLIRLDDGVKVQIAKEGDE